MEDCSQSCAVIASDRGKYEPIARLPPAGNGFPKVNILAFALEVAEEIFVGEGGRILEGESGRRDGEGGRMAEYVEVAREAGRV